MSTPIVISIIALIFSATTLGWNIYQYYDKIKGKIRIDFKYRTSINSIEIIGYGFTVTNTCQIPIFISNYEYYMDGLKGQHVSFADYLIPIRHLIKAIFIQLPRGD